METSTVRVVELDEHQQMTERLIDDVSSYTVHADGTLEVVGIAQSLHYDFHRWVDVKFIAT